MKNILNILFQITFSLITINPTHAYNLKQVSQKENFSNTSITSFCQDEKGIMWIGTCDGLNTYNGREISIYTPSNAKNSLSGNFIGKILYTDDNIYWMQNYHGLNKYNTKTNKLIKYYEFSKVYFIEKDNFNNIIIINDKSNVYYYHKQSDSFKKIIFSVITTSEIYRFFIDKDNNAWIITRNGKTYSYKISKNSNSGEITLSLNTEQNYSKKLFKSCFYNDNLLQVIDQNNNLFIYDLKTKLETPIFNLNHEIKVRGEVTEIYKYRNRYFIGFALGGLIILEENPKTGLYTFSELDINCGITCIKKDRLQDILWIGTDGQGVYLYSETSYSIKSTILNNEAYKIGHPIRTIFLDKDQTLWIGTKGDGILKIFKYDVNKNIANCQTEKITSTNSLLNSNAVYCFAESKKNLLWIGNEEGLNYFSYKDNKTKNIKLKINDHAFKYIHDIYEDDNSNIWIASLGMGIIKAHVDGTINEPILTNIQYFSINNSKHDFNYFTTIFPENDTTIWFGNKGHGPFRINTRINKLIPLNFFNDYKPNTINDIFTINKDKYNNYLFGTGYGLIQYNSNGDYKIYNSQNGFLNNPVQATLNGNNNDIWLCTNRGIFVFNSAKNTFRVFENEYSQNIVVFAYGSAFKDKNTGTLFFGGINGFISIIERNILDPKYCPPVNFDKLKLFGQNNNILQFIDNDKKSNTLNLKHNQNFFSIAFTAIDYFNGNNYTYEYRLIGLNDQWINNDRSDVATFTNIAPGNYTLQVKYYNRTEGLESKIYTINIRVGYPWYRTIWAYSFYFIVLIILIYLANRFIMMQIKHKEQKKINDIEKKHQKEVFESKLDFFTNITHEFSAPLTLISGPCERILAQKDINKFVRNYAQMIKTNSTRLYSLIQELIEFRKIETENRNLQIECLDILDSISITIDTFKVMAEAKKIKFEAIIPKELVWNTDKGFFISIVINLLSNAFKYTSNGKKIKFEISIKNNTLIIDVKNQGNINEADFVHIFDRFTVLENFEKQENRQSFSRSGLGLAISSNMIKLLNGKITVTNTTDNWIKFSVDLPMLTTTSNMSDNNLSRYIPSVEVPLSITLHESEIDKMKPTILIIDDEIEVLWLISEILSDNYNTIRLQDATKIDHILQDYYPDLIISDVMMPNLNGIDLTKKILNNKETKHIPVILVSANHNVEQQIESLALGAEMYITKPFNTEYFKIYVNQLFERKEKFKNYYNSPISSFDMNDGKLTHKDHRKFLQSVLSIINDNITDPNLSTQFIAEKLKMGSRSLYRKIKEIGEDSPSTLIRESRLFVARNLLVQTTLNIDEIIFKSGFTDKSTFFKLFNKKFNCTPKEYRSNNIDNISK